MLDAPAIKSYSLKRKIVSIMIEDQPFELVEMDGEQRDTYLNYVGGKMKTTTTGAPAGLKNFNNLESHLVGKHLRRAGETEYLPEKEIQAFPASMLADLAEDCRKLSGLDKEGEDEAKNG